jgi:hypothetical protein
LNVPIEDRSRNTLAAGRVTRNTLAKREELYSHFVAWLTLALPNFEVPFLVREHTAIFLDWVEEYTIQRYLEGWSRTRAAEALLALQDRYGILRGNMGGPWRIMRSWALTEPVSLHPPCPVALLKAMVVTALAWSWFEVATTLLTGFFGLLRPIEYLRAKVSDLILPRDHDGGRVVFVNIPEHKTQRRGPRRAHVRVDEKEVVDFLEWRAAQLKPWMPLWSGSAHTWRKRLETLAFFLTGVRKVILPSSLRPGGATYFFQKWDENLPRLQWRGRWASARMLEHYVQELVGCQILHRVESNNRARIESLAALYLPVLTETCGNQGESEAD